MATPVQLLQVMAFSIDGLLCSPDAKNVNDYSGLVIEFLAKVLNFPNHKDAILHAPLNHLTYHKYC